MKASYLKSYGQADSLQYGELPDPVIKEKSLLVEVKAVSVNPVDWKVRQGLLKIILGSKFPKIIGSDFSGIVKEVAQGVENFKPGDRVYGVISAFSGKPGALAGIANVDAKDARAMPDWLSFEDAASLPVAALTATNGLRRCGVVKGSRLLINGATGGVGHFGVQAAKAIGAHVTATCSEGNFELAKKLGADEVFGYSGDNSIGAGIQFDAILDAWGMMAHKEIHRLLKPEGVYASPLLMPWSVFTALWVRLRYGRKMTSSNMRKRPEDYDELEALMEKKKLQPVIENIFPLEKSSEAFDKAEFGKPRGKVIIQVG
ncbi:MAG: NAD(P)-dependent alcohol dehydrogenase [Bacteroidales bacterium]|nr:NAD(P)-dependent alcohol dehydrogenase [Bacteroidales bacterium]MCF8405373.1 NAD(P)-dependent alcohol dehydrogenase [Bacteroidales bacterium]